MCIWDAQAIVEYFNDLTYVHLMKSTILVEKLSGKKPLKYGMPNLELKLIDIMQTMEDFLNRLSDQQFMMPAIQ